MKVKYIEEEPVKAERFRRLGSWYILALSAIAIVAIAGQVLVQRHLKKQDSDSRMVNVAGRQRMLSQKITKTALLLTAKQSHYTQQELITELTSSLHLWKVSQAGLMHGNDSLRLPGKNSERVTKMFEQVNGHFDAICQSTDQLIKGIEQHTISDDAVASELNIILKEEPLFLSGMNDIAFQYDDEAHARVARLRNLEYLLAAITIVVIVLELFFIFRPTAAHVNKTIERLMASEKSQKVLAKEIGALYASLEVSYEQLSHISQPTETPRLLARSDRGGNITSIAPAYTTLTGRGTIAEGMQVSDLFDAHNKGVDWMDEIIDTVANGATREEQVRFTAASEAVWIDLQITPIHNAAGEIEEWVITGSDITDRKTAEGKMNKKTRDEIEKKINQQKFRSVLILEGQEEERKRIAMDIHDGIGQMLTSLKFQIESLTLTDHEKLRQKMDEVKELITQVIKEVRRVTFNLKPTVLGDYGLEAALKLFVTEIAKLTDIDMRYEAIGIAPYRLPQKIENNLFRIVQEAVNNSIKYSKAEKIEVVLQWTAEQVVVVVKDNGQGFDEKLLKERSNNIESGRGFFNMYERTEYVNGILDIKSIPGSGTSVTLVMPLHTPVVTESEEQTA